MENSLNFQVEATHQELTNNKDGGVKIKIRGNYHNGNEVDEEYYADCFLNEKIDHSSSFRISQTEPENSSVNVFRFNDPSLTISFFMSFWFDGKTYRNPNIQVETNLWFDKYRKISTNLYLCSEDACANASPIRNLKFNRRNRILYGSFNYNPLGHKNVVVSGEFDVRLKMI